jgi:biotin transport system substrate-specific component
MEICGREIKVEYFNLNKIAMAFLFAGLTGLAAQIRIPLPFTPVPITAQVLFVLLCGIMLGKYGGLSQLIYVGGGAAGIPWFNNMTGGVSALSGVTGGYLAGFILAAFLIGSVVESYPAILRRFTLLFFLMLTGVGVIYTFGVIYLAFVLGVGIKEAAILGVLPFIVGDLVKASIAALIGGGYGIGIRKVQA